MRRSFIYYLGGVGVEIGSNNCRQGFCIMRRFRSLKRQSGQAIVEMVASIIMFAAMVTTITGVSAYLYVQHVMITAAREGARVASLNTGLGGTDITGGTNAVISAVQNITSSMSGIQLQSAEIQVTPPSSTDAYGQKTVMVTVQHNFQNPIPVDSFLNGFGGQAANLNLDTIPVQATAMMRYEE